MPPVLNENMHDISKQNVPNTHDVAINKKYKSGTRYA